MTERDKKTEPKRNKELPSRAFHLEACRSAKGMSVIISGVVAISDFTDSEVTLKSHGGRVTLLGKRLSVTVYEGGAVEIVGKTEDIRFSYGKN